MKPEAVISGKTNIVATGSRAGISTDHKIRAGEIKTYFTPGFYVTSPGYGSPSVFYRIRKHGYQGAYIKAIKKYAEIYRVPPNEKLALLARIPDRSLFTGYLLDRIRLRGGGLSKKELNKMLDAMTTSGNRETLREMMEKRGLTPRDVAAILSKGSPDKDVTERAVKSWVCSPNLSDARTCDDWVIDLLRKAKPR